MNKKKKRLLLALSVTAFVVVSFVAVLYAQGYRYSLADGQFQLTGALSFKANESARVFINDDFMGTTSFFSNSFNADRLLPGVYSIVVQKDGYSSWRKSITIEEGFVVDFPSVLLLPLEGQEREEVLAEIEKIEATPTPTPTTSPTKTPKPTRTPNNTKASPTPSPTPEIFEEPFVLRSGKLYEVVNQKLVERFDQVEGFSLSKNNDRLTWWDRSEVWVVWLVDTNYQPFKKSGDAELIIRLPNQVQSVRWYTDKDHLLIKLTSKNTRYKIIEIDKRGGVNVVDF